MQFAPLNIRVIACGGKNIFSQKLFLKEPIYMTLTRLFLMLLSLNSRGDS